MMPNQYKGKVVWITGASAGIGESLALAFAEQGASLVLSARNENALEAVATACRQIGAGTVMVQPLDLANAASFPGIAARVKTQMQHIDILINNGGVSQRTLVKETPMELYRQLMEVNFFGAIALTKEVLPGMLERHSGTIVAMSSLVGKIGSKYRSGYAASKHALHGFFDSLRAEVADEGVKVLLVCPGSIKTNVSINALNADGSPTGKMDKNQEQGMLPEMLADKILKAIRDEKQELYAGGKEIMAIYVKRFFPRLLSKIIRKRY